METLGSKYEDGRGVLLNFKQYSEDTNFEKLSRGTGGVLFQV